MNKRLLSLYDVTETKVKTLRGRESADRFVHRNILSCAVSFVFSALYSWSYKIFFQCYLMGVTTVFMNVILAFILSFFHFIWKKMSSLCHSSYLFHFLPQPQRKTSGRMHILTIFLFSSLSLHFFFLLLFHHPRAEEPHCSLLTFSYHLSPFHHHHYLPTSSPVTPASCHFSSLSLTSLVCCSLISILLLLQGTG